VLDNPVWSALTTDHAHLAVVAGEARRYPFSVARFAALGHAGAWGDLEELVAVGEVVALVTEWPVTVPGGWTVVRERVIEQMVCSAAPPAGAADVLELGDADAPEMLALARATDPGPFFEATHTLGRFVGVREAGRLLAMAGERMQLAGHVEVSAVCTDPGARGRGYARTLMETLMRREFAEGRVPFLHVKNENGAKLLYERLGFEVRAPMHLTVVTRGRP